MGKTIATEDEAAREKTAIRSALKTVLARHTLEKSFSSTRIERIVTILHGTSSTVHRKKLSAKHSLKEVQDNIEGVLSFFKDRHRPAKEAFGSILYNPDLLFFSKEKIEGRFQAITEKLCTPSCFPNENEVLTYCAHYATLFSSEPTNVARTTKMNLLFLESPYIRFSYDERGKSFFSQRLHQLQHFPVMSTSNIAMRMAAAEISSRADDLFKVKWIYKPYCVDTAASFHRGQRKEMESKLMEALGHTSGSKSNILIPPAPLMTVSAQTAKKEALERSLNSYIDRSIEWLDGQKTPQSPRNWPFPVFSILNDESDDKPPESKEACRSARANLVLGRFVESYKLGSFGKA